MTTSRAGEPTFRRASSVECPQVEVQEEEPEQEQEQEQKKEERERVPPTVPLPRGKTETEPEFEESQFAQPRASALRMLPHHLGSLWKQRRFLARVAVAGLLSGTLVAFLLPKRFQSTAQLMPPDTQSSSGMAMLAAVSARAGGGLGSLSSSVLGGNSTGALFTKILTSRTVESRLVERFDLRKIYGCSFEEDARRKLAENTGISDDRLSGVITIAVTDRDPQRAAAMAQAYVEELNRLVVELSTSSAHRERVFLEERLRAVKAELDQAAAEFSRFASENVAIDVKEQGRAMVDAAATLMGQLIAAESELKGLEAIYTPGNVRVRSVEARVAELRKQLQEKMGSKDGGDDKDAAGASGDTFYPTLRSLPLLGVTYGDLYRRTKIQEAVYETLTQEYELAKVQEAKETPSVKVLDAPTIPERKSYPPRLAVILLCFSFSMTGAVVWVLGRTFWEATDRRDPSRVLAQEVFHSLHAAMPWAPPNGSRLQAMTHRVWVRLDRRPRRGNPGPDPD
jgi:capsule polysaccharide export protein KpsE/RkpR